MPKCNSLSLSAKQEETYSTKEELHQAIFDVWKRMFSYIGKSLEKHEIVFGDPTGDNQLIGWENVRPIFIRQHCIGFCGER